MDVVITYVDFTNIFWKEAYETTIKENYKPTIHTSDSISRTRFVNHGEIRFLLRSIEKYIPWVRNIYMVIDDYLEKPAWLTGVNIIRHKEIFQEYADSCLPTFNSQAIETVLHRIKDISEPFLYFNDDMFVGKKIEYENMIKDTKMALIPSDCKSKVGKPKIQEIGFRCAWKNVNRLLDERFGKCVRYKLEHAPYIISPKLMNKIWAEFHTDMEKTIRSRFRAIYDVNVSPALHPYYALHTDEGFIQKNLEVKTFYLNLKDKKETLKKIHELTESAPHFFCLEDEDGGNESDNTIRRILEIIFPTISKYECLEMPLLVPSPLSPNEHD